MGGLQFSGLSKPLLVQVTAGATLMVATTGPGTVGSMAGLHENCEIKYIEIASYSLTMPG